MGFEEDGEGTPNRVRHTADGRKRPFLFDALGRHVRARRFGGQDGGDQADGHRDPAQAVGQWPTQMLRRDQDQRIGADHRDAVAERVGRREQPKLVRITRDFDPPGGQRDVLGGRRKGDEQRAGAKHREAMRRSHGRHRKQACHDRKLRCQQPAAAAAENLQHGYAVQQRCPDELQRVGDTHP